MTESMVRVERRLPAGARLARALIARAEQLSLGYEDRRRSRLRARLSNGEEVALMLPRGTVLIDGDLLIAADGRLIRVEAQSESVLEVTHQDPSVLLRIAYHLGNRHVPVQLGINRLLLGVDPVLADMARQLGGEVAEINCAFEPEAGAYGGGHRHGHADTFEEDDALAKKSFAVHWAGAGEGSAAEGNAAEQLHQRDEAAEHLRHEQHAHPAGQAHGHDHSHDHDHSTMTMITEAASVLPFKAAEIQGAADLPVVSPAQLPALMRLLQLASPALPVGGYSYSQALEAAVHGGQVSDAVGAQRWISNVLHRFMARSEAPVVLLAGSYLQHDSAMLLSLNACYLASRESAAARDETRQMGWSLLHLAAHCDWLEAPAKNALEALPEPVFPVIFGACGAALVCRHRWCCRVIFFPGSKIRSSPCKNCCL